MATRAISRWPEHLVSSAGTANPPKLEPISRAAFSDLEWSIVAMAESDRVASLREPNRFWAVVGVLFGLRPANRLANDRLEALRRTAVLTWRERSIIPQTEVEAFLRAGFSPAQLELLQDTIVELRGQRTPRGKR
ncbi:MAG: hypothetical protein ABIQ32_10045 [Sphingomicrobium sp.]